MGGPLPAVAVAPLQGGIDRVQCQIPLVIGQARVPCAAGFSVTRVVALKIGGAFPGVEVQAGAELVRSVVGQGRSDIAGKVAAGHLPSKSGSGRVASGRTPRESLFSALHTGLR